MHDAPPAAYRWRVLGVGVLAQMTSGLAFFPGLAVVGPALTRWYHLNLVEVGVLFGGMQLGPVLTIAAWGVVADRKGDRLVLGIGLGLGAVVLAAAALAPNFSILVGAVTVSSMLMASANVASSRAAAGWFAANERGLALGVRQMTVPLGGVVAALALPVVSVALGIPATFVVLGIACGAVGVVASIALTRPLPSSRRPVVDVIGVWRDRRLWRLAVGVGFLIVCQNSLLTYLVLFLTGQLHLGLSAAAFAFLMTQVAGALMRVGIGRLSDRIRLRIRPMRWVAASLVLVLLILAVAGDLPLVVVVPAAMVAAIIGMGTTGLAYTATAEIAGIENAGTAIGFEITLFAIAGTIAPVLFGSVVAWLGWPAAFVLTAASAGVGWAVLRRLANLESHGWAAVAVRARELATATSTQ